MTDLRDKISEIVSEAECRDDSGCWASVLDPDVIADDILALPEIAQAQARAEAAEARFIEQRDSLVSVTKKLAQTEARLAEEQRISTLRKNTIELDLIPSLSDAHAAIPRAWQMGLDAAAGECELGAHIMSHHGSQTQEDCYTNAYKAIRTITPPADLVQQATKETDHE